MKGVLLKPDIHNIIEYSILTMDTAVILVKDKLEEKIEEKIEVKPNTTTKFKLNMEHKRIFDDMHDYIMVSNLAILIIDSQPFQRLHKLKQLGACLFVFPDAKGARFEHSLGTYHLARRILRCINTRTKPSEIEDYLKSIPELADYYKRTYNSEFAIIDDYLIELIAIAGLCHDVGHGPFSHVYDDEFIPTTGKKPSVNDIHEARSGAILEYIIKHNKILSSVIKPGEIQFMMDCINPKSKHWGFLYEIISNSRNGIDVDKFEYLCRDARRLNMSNGFDYTRLVDDVYIVDNTICYYPKHVASEAIKMYHTRYNMHKQVYSHKSVIAAQIMITELMHLLDPILELSSAVDDIEKFCELTDEYLMNSVIYLSKPFVVLPPEHKVLVTQAKKLVDRLNIHDIYKCMGSYAGKKQYTLTKDDFNKFPEYNDTYANNIVIHTAKIGYVSGNKKNPLDNLYTFTPGPGKDIMGNGDETSQETKRVRCKINISEVTILTPLEYQEHILMIFYKDREDRQAHKLVTSWIKELVGY